MKKGVISRIFLNVIISTILFSCTALHYDKLGREESYGYVTLKEANIYDSPSGVRVVGKLPMYYKFRLEKNEIEIDNGLTHIRYSTERGKDYPDGWVELNALKIFSLWEFPVEDASVQQDVSHEIFPIVAAKAQEFIAAIDKDMEQWDPDYIKMISNGEVHIGMTPEMVLLSIGMPNKVNKTQGVHGIEEQWIYTKSKIKTSYVYIANGKVINTQIVGENVQSK